MIIDIGTAVIISSLISILGAILIMNTNLRNYFKKQNFNLKIQAEKLKIKKIERDLNLKPSSLKSDKGLIESIKDIDIDKIKGLLDTVSNDEEESEGDITSRISNIIEKNPELVEKYAPKLIELFTGKKDNFIPPEER